MKKVTLTFAILGAFCACAFAGPEPMSSKEVMPVPVPPTSCFEGWYFGIHGGGILTEFDSQTSAFEDTEPPRSFGFSESAFDETGRRRSDSTWEGGLHAGYNWQRGAWVFGLEVDIQGSNFERQDSALAFIDLPTDEDEDFDHQYSTEIHSTTKLDWYSTGRVRIGHTLGDRIMVFGTGGGAVGLTEVSESTDVFATTTEGGAKTAFLTNSNRDIRGGWTGGGGFDFCLTPHIILNFTYLYVDLGDESVSSSALLTLPARFGVRTFDSETRARSDFQFHVFQGGISFK